MQGGVPFKAVDQDSSPKLPPFDAEQELLVSHSKSISNIKPYPPTMLSEEYAAAEKSISGNIESTKKTLLLDLDYTLIKSISYKRKLEELGKDREKRRHDFQICLFTDGKPQVYYVYERPGLREFLKKVTSMFEVWIYTASEKVYADAVIDKLDPNGEIFKNRLYRENCLKDEEGRVLKDLATIPEKSLQSMVLIDDDYGHV